MSCDVHHLPHRVLRRLVLPRVQLLLHRQLYLPGAMLHQPPHLLPGKYHPLPIYPEEPRRPRLLDHLQSR